MKHRFEWKAESETETAEGVLTMFAILFNPNLLSIVSLKDKYLAVRGCVIHVCQQFAGIFQIRNFCYWTKNKNSQIFSQVLSGLFSNRSQWDMCQPSNYFDFHMLFVLALRFPTLVWQFIYLYTYIYIWSLGNFTGSWAFCLGTCRRNCGRLLRPQIKRYMHAYIVYMEDDDRLILWM